MVKVGVPHWTDESLLTKLPANADVRVLPKAPSTPIEIDFRLRHSF